MASAIPAGTTKSRLRAFVKAHGFVFKSGRGWFQPDYCLDREGNQVLSPWQPEGGKLEDIANNLLWANRSNGVHIKL